MNKLIGMVEFVLQHAPKAGWQVGNKKYTEKSQLDLLVAYANFLKRPLELGMFVPADENGGVLDEPKPENFTHAETDTHFSEYQGAQLDWLIAKGQVLFEGFEVNYWNNGMNSKGSFELINKELNIQICTYKQQPNYFTWNNGGKEEHPTVEFISGKGLTLTDTAKKLIGL